MEFREFHFQIFENFIMTSSAGDKISFFGAILSGTEVFLRSRENSKFVRIFTNAIFTSTTANLERERCFNINQILKIPLKPHSNTDSRTFTKRQPSKWMTILNFFWRKAIWIKLVGVWVDFWIMVDSVNWDNHR
jgi:hypothetical protein